MLHQKVPPPAQRERGDHGVLAQKSLVVAVVRDAVRAGGIIVDEEEIETFPGDTLGHAPQHVEALGDRPRMPRVFSPGDRLLRACFEERAVAVAVAIGEGGGLVDAEEGRVAGRVDVRLDVAPLDLVLDAVEGELAVEEAEEVFLGGFGDEGGEISEIEVGLILDDAGRGCWAVF